MVKSRDYFSIIYLCGAAAFTREILKIEDSGPPDDQASLSHRAYVLSAITSSAAALEAMINEIFADAVEKDGGCIASIPVDARRNLAALWKRQLQNAYRPMLEKFNLALVLGVGGVTMFFGPPADGYRFFGSWLERQKKPNRVDNPRDMFDMLNQRERPIWDAMRAHNPATPRFAARHQAAREWNAEFMNPQSPLFQRMFGGRRAVGTGAHAGMEIGSRPGTSG